MADATRIEHQPTARRMDGSAEGGAAGRIAGPGVVHGLAPVAPGAVVRRDTAATHSAVDLNPKRERTILTARSRNRMLLWLGYTPRVPYCELEGRADPKARRVYLFGVPCGFTRTDRSMAVWDGKRKAWRLVMDDSWYPQLFSTKDGALAAGRKAEQAADARAKSAATREAQRATAWMREPYTAFALRRGLMRTEDDDAAERRLSGAC